MNQISTIHPYRLHGEWVFDDPDVGLVKEAFVAGADEVCDRIMAEINRKFHRRDEQFTLRFSKGWFPGSQLKFEHVGPSPDNGNYYYCPSMMHVVWLCPALFKYFDEAPKEIFVKAEAK